LHLQGKARCLSIALYRHGDGVKDLRYLIGREPDVNDRSLDLDNGSNALTAPSVPVLASFLLLRCGVSVIYFALLAAEGGAVERLSALALGHTSSFL
jgi:hypothetical protein